MDITKPIPPIEPKFADYPESITASPSLNSPYVVALKKYKKELEKYNADLETYEQLKLIKFVKAANPKLILKKYKIIKLK